MGKNVYYDIEIKSRSASKTGIEDKLDALIRSNGLEERCIISSFNPMPLKFFKKISPNIPTAIIYCSNGELPWYLRLGEGRWIAGADILKPAHKKVNKLLTGFNRIAGSRPVLPWTVDEPEEAERLLKAGVSGVISNDPDAVFSREI